MASRFVRPDTTVLKISHGDTLTVKRRLNAGEARTRKGMASFATLDQVAVVLAYLVDWSLTDDEGKHVSIAGLSAKDLCDRLDGLDSASFEEIYAAIVVHEKAMDAERETAKNGPDGGSGSPATLPSLELVAGASNGSASSI